MTTLRLIVLVVFFCAPALAQQQNASPAAPPKAAQPQPSGPEKAVPPVKGGPLSSVKIIQVDATVVSNPSKVKEDWAANWIRDQLIAALQKTGFQAGESPIHAKIVLDEFTSGSMAKRFMIGMGAGRSSITAHLIVEDSSKQLTASRIHVRGGLLFSPYQGGNTQTRQAENSFEQKLVEEIEKLK